MKCGRSRTFLLTLNSIHSESEAGAEEEAQREIDLSFEAYLFYTATESNHNGRF